LTPKRALVLCEPAALAGLRDRLGAAAAGASQPASVVDVSTVFAALTLVGPLAREVLARFCAIDLRPSATPAASVRPGSIARQPGILVCEARERFLFLFGWAVGHYMWSVVADAGAHLGARPVGVDALAPLKEPLEELPSRA
jgi:heterotetrameric sarcosine oxidase gamma subunit